MAQAKWMKVGAAAFLTASMLGACGAEPQEGEDLDSEDFQQDEEEREVETNVNTDSDPDDDEEEDEDSED